MLYADYNFLIHDNITYSVDMLRLRANITREKYSYIEFILKTCYSDIIKNYYESNSIGDFRYNYNLQLSSNSSFWFGYFHNSELYNNKGSYNNDKTEYNFTLEFNPNKVPIFGFLSFLLKNIGCFNWFVKSCDISMDLPINILDLCGFDKKRYKDIRIFNAGFDNRTIYIGRTNNRVKIYNKARESGLSYNLTRIEVSTKLDVSVREFSHSFNLKINLPEIFTNDYLYSFSDFEDRTLLAILYAVQNGFPLNDLSRRYKTKVKSLLSGGNRVALDIKCCSDVLCNCIHFIFSI